MDFIKYAAKIRNFLRILAAYSSKITAAQRHKYLSSGSCTSTIFLNHPEVLQRLCDRFFLLRWALGLLGVFGFRLIVVFTLDDTALLLYLCDIQITDSGRYVPEHTL